MADPIVIPQTYQVAIEAQSGGQRVVNVIGIRSSFSNANEVGLAVKNRWEATSGPRNAHPTQYAMDGYRVTDLSSVDGPVVFINGSGTGGQSGSLATNGSCGLVSFNGGTRSRSSSGRMYHGPLLENDINADGRTLTTTKQNGLSAVYQLFKADLQGDGFEWVVISRKLEKAFPIGTPAAQNIIATQRRRIRGR